MKQVLAYIQSRAGATAIEYALIGAGISLAIVALVFVFGDQLRVVYGEMETSGAEIETRVQTSR